jgi:hypothetical protein
MSKYMPADMPLALLTVIEFEPAVPPPVIETVEGKEQKVVHVPQLGPPEPILIGGLFVAVEFKIV